MGSLIYTLNVSLDGYIETPDRSLLWTTSTRSCLHGSTTAPGVSGEAIAQMMPSGLRANQAADDW